MKIEIEAIRPNTRPGRDGKPSAIKAYVDFIVEHEIKILDATLKEVPQDRNNPNGPRVLRLFLPGTWTGDEGKRSFKPSLQVKAATLAAWEADVCIAYHEAPAPDAEGGEWRS